MTTTVTPSVTATTIDTTAQAAPQGDTAPATEAPKTNQMSDSDRMAKLARREMAIRDQAKQIQREKEELNSLRSQLANQKPPEPDMSWKNKLTEDPIAFLQDNGLSYEQLTNMLLNVNPTDQNVKQVMVKIKEIEERQNKAANQIQEQTTQQYNQALTQMQHEVKRLAASSDDFELIRKSGEEGEKAVVKYIESHWKDKGELLEIEEVAKMVEDVLLEDALQYAQLKKVQARLTPSQAAAQAEVVPPQTNINRSFSRGPTITTKTPTTLSHNMSNSSTPPTDKDRRARAIAAFMGK